ncbi:hypothetical protein PoB_005413600 [Plakobranchus ocellatus]|uniref:Uncharacterized protein n=1 Tax=Plakobranchus ocellatus TaxID=259542 RepID=A0AAV4C8H1_9GAST|nr:hypothetical protein PoB_005413600 [Plakobranchus ocellatus]
METNCFSGRVNRLSPNSGETLRGLWMKDSPASVKLVKLKIINLYSLERSDVVRIFRARAKHTLLLSDRARQADLLKLAYQNWVGSVRRKR